MVLIGEYIYPSWRGYTDADRYSIFMQNPYKNVAYIASADPTACVEIQ